MFHLMLLKLNLEFQASLVCQVGAGRSDSTLCSLLGGPVCLCVLSHVPLFATLWTLAHQAPLCMGFSRQEWSGLPSPPPGDLPNPEKEPVSLAAPALQANSLVLSRQRSR